MMHRLIFVASFLAACSGPADSGAPDAAEPSPATCQARVERIPPSGLVLGTVSVSCDEPSDARVAVRLEVWRADAGIAVDLDATAQCGGAIELRSTTPPLGDGPVYAHIRALPLGGMPCSAEWTDPQ